MRVADVVNAVRLAGACVLLTLLGCSTADGTSTTSPDASTGIGTTTCAVSPSCPDAAVPSYSAEIAPFLAQTCIPCHSPNGIGGFDESSYQKVYDQRSPMLDQVYDCQMPPANGPQLTSAQRVALTAWLECGAPNN